MQNADDGNDDGDSDGDGDCGDRLSESDCGVEEVSFTKLPPGRLCIDTDGGGRQIKLYK